jgi:DNA-directed RNA polymerase specialized sigma24 family protein
LDQTVVKSFCISELRSRNGKRKIKIVYDETSVEKSKDFDDFKIDTDGDQDLLVAISDFLKHLNKRDALILKMKYYYGKSSIYISQKMNEAHINVCIQRIKERLLRKTGLTDIEGFVRKYRTYI